MYKISYKSITRTNENGSKSGIPEDPTNRDYQQFIQDAAEQGIEIVEGPDITEPDYASLRQQEYPSREEQLDMMYWDRVNGTNVWEETIQAIKAKYPKTITGGTTIGEVPDWVQEAADNWTFNRQLREYVDAVERLERYVLSEGVAAVIEDRVIGTEKYYDHVALEEKERDIIDRVVIKEGIDPIERTIEVVEHNQETKEQTTKIIDNPLVVKDEEERRAAQEVVDSTPLKVIEAYNSAL
tara:strand:- start:42 stop:761 length:720 start_codon:yes stop_codon:yes gene_type:complete